MSQVKFHERKMVVTELKALESFKVIAENRLGNKRLQYFRNETKCRLDLFFQQCHLKLIFLVYVWTFLQRPWEQRLMCTGERIPQDITARKKRYRWLCNEEMLADYCSMDDNNKHQRRFKSVLIAQFLKETNIKYYIVAVMIC